MASIRIENLGPIVDSSTITLTPITLLMGPQSAGKSTFMKVLCFCCWIEKRIMVSTADIINQYTHYGRFIRDLKQFHRISDDFFTKNTKIYYESEVLSIVYTGEKNPRITRKKIFPVERYNTKLSYIPAERNLMAAVKNIDRAYRSSDRDVLFNLIYEWDEARLSFTQDNPHPLSVTGGFKYFNRNGEDELLMSNGKVFPAFYASSGLQSVMPLEVMSKYFLSLVGKISEFSKHDLSVIMEILNMDDREGGIRSMPNDDRRLELLRKRMIYQSAQLFIEEPEQNLYPESQRLLLISLFRYLCQALKIGSKESRIIMTTHSPYVLSVLNVLYRASIAYEDKPAVSEIIDEDLLLPSNCFSAYFINDGLFSSVLDSDIPMFSGEKLDGVSDWVDDRISRLNDLIYGEE